jgi:DNA-binding transcriptional LysR family regulator
MQMQRLLRRLDLTTLKLLLSIHAAGSLTCGAQEEAMAPSAASKRVAELEDAIGMSVFLRNAKGMVLTPAGEILLAHARRVLMGVEMIGIELAEYAEGVRGYVRVVANLSAIVEFLPEDIRLFLQRHGTVKLHLEERSSAGVIKAVEEHWADIGICSGDVDTRSLLCVPYQHDSLVLVASREGGLLGRSSIRFHETLDLDHIGLHAESSINHRTQLMARQMGKSLKMRIHVPCFDAVCRMAQAGLGVGIVPAYVYQTFGRPLGLLGIPLEDDWAYRELKLVVRDTSSLSPATRALYDHLRFSLTRSRLIEKTERFHNENAC